MQVTVQKLSHRGEGLLDSESPIRFITKVLPGEVLTIEGGKLQSVDIQSPERIAPICPHFARCGGCGLQHWQAEPYAIWKRDLIAQALSDVNLHPTVGTLIDGHGAGRRRATFHVRKLSTGWHAGFMEPRSHDLCAIDHCPILVPALHNAPAIAAVFGPQLGPCDVAFTAADNGLDVSVKAERKLTEGRQQAMAELLTRFKLARLSINGEIVATAQTPQVAMGTTRVALPNLAFLQATAKGEALLGDYVMQGLGNAKSVVDLFCGLGPFSLRIATIAKVLAVDTDRAAVASLQAAFKQTMGLKPLTTQVRDLFREPMMASELKDFDAVIFDPPRAGADAQARQLAKTKIKTVIAVSCDPQTLARDARILVDGGYTIKQVTPIDQFKWSAHVETVMVLRR
jgi:23S rRNA (uracil1939-C5)-methyltransferase